MEFISLKQSGLIWTPQNSTVVYLRLDQAFTWEVPVIKSANKSKLATIFIDPPVMEALGNLTLEQQHATTRYTNNINNKQHNQLKLQRQR